MPKAKWYAAHKGYSEPLVEDQLDARFLMTMSVAQRDAIDERAETAGLSRNAYIRKALYHYTEKVDPLD